MRRGRARGVGPPSPLMCDQLASESVPSLTFADISFAYPRSGLWQRPAMQVFRDFSWQTPAGRTVILGPNGAGKTTLLSLGATALMPSSGAIRFGDLDPARRRDRRLIRQAVGWMPQFVRPIPGLTAREQVAYGGWLKGMPRAEAWSGAMTALQRVALKGEANTLVSQLSGGQQRRVGLAQSLVHQAAMLLLDEPSVGLDPGQRSRFRELLQEIAQGVPIIVSTHQVDDLTDLFDTVVILDHGRVRFQGSVGEFVALAPAADPHRAESAYASIIATER
jgi:ABC-2 type transport system ATP-binding protein